MSILLQVPESVTFEQAIALTQSLLSLAQSGSLQESEIAALIAELVKTENGARGFFVNYLTSDSLPDINSTSVVQALRTNPEVVGELLIKNLAMSTAQAIYHHRNQKEDMAEASEQVRQRTARLIEGVELPSCYDRAQKLLHSAKTGEGDYKAFLERWGYDTEQRQAICQALQAVISKSK